MSPRADFVCNSKKCETPEGAPMLELPVDATRCPMCGSKRLKRLFNKVGVIGTRHVTTDPDWRLTSNSPLERSKALLQDDFDAAYARKSRASELPTWSAGSREHEVETRTGKFIMPAASQAAAMLGLSGPGRPMKQLEIQRAVKSDPHGVPATLHRLNRAGIPTTVVGRQRT